MHAYIFIVSRESFDFDLGAAELLKNPSGVSAMVNGHSHYTAELMFSNYTAELQKFHLP